MYAYKYICVCVCVCVLPLLAPVIDFSISMLLGDGRKRVTLEPIWKQSALNQTTLVSNGCCLGELYCHR